MVSCATGTTGWGEVDGSGGKKVKEKLMGRGRWHETGNINIVFDLLHDFDDVINPNLIYGTPLGDLMMFFFCSSVARHFSLRCRGEWGFDWNHPARNKRLVMSHLGFCLTSQMWLTLSPADTISNNIELSNQATVVVIVCKCSNQQSHQWKRDMAHTEGEAEI